GTVAARVLRGHAHRAAVRVAPLGLDAADGHHHGPGGIGVVGALCEALDDVVAGGDLPGGADFDVLPQTGTDQRVVHGDQPLCQRHADVVLELQRGGPGTALGAVDDDEIRGGAHLPHRLADREHLVARAHAQLETGRFPAGELTHPGDELDQLGGGIEDFVCRGADAFLSLWDLPGRGDLRIDLGTGQYAADPGFGALAELEGDAFDLLSLGGVGEIVRIEVAVGSARAEVAGADLPDQITVMLFVVGGDAAFAGVVGEVPDFSPFVQGADRDGGQRTETHRRDSQQRHRVRLAAVRSADQRPRRVRGLLHRGHRVHQVLVPGAVDIPFGAEGLLPLDALGTLI